MNKYVIVNEFNDAAYIQHIGSKDDVLADINKLIDEVREAVRLFGADKAPINMSLWNIGWAFFDCDGRNNKVYSLDEWFDLRCENK